MFKPEQGDSLKRSGFNTTISGQDGSYQAAEVGVPGTGGVGSESYYMEGAARAIVLVAERYDESNQANVSGEKIRIRGFVGLAVNVMVNGGRTGGILTNPHRRPRRVVDTTRTERAFPLSAAVSQSDGLSDTSRSWERRMHQSMFPAVGPRSE